MPIRLAPTLMVVISAFGCHDAPEPRSPRLTVTGVAFDDSTRPTTITLLVANGGDLTANLTECEVDIHRSFLLTPDKAAAPDRFEYEFGIKNGAVKIAPGESVAVAILGTWNVGGDAIPVSAICQATFTLTDPRGGRLRAGPATFVMNTKEFGAHLVGKEHELQQTVKGLEGAKSELVQRIFANQ